MTDERSIAVHAAIKKALRDYRCQNTAGEDGEKYPLVDALTPPDAETIAAGENEIELLTDEVWWSLQPLLGMPNPHQQGRQE